MPLSDRELIEILNNDERYTQPHFSQPNTVWYGDSREFMYIEKDTWLFSYDSEDNLHQVNTQTAHEYYHLGSL